MSINSIVNAAAARRPDMVPVGVVPSTYSEIALAASTAPTNDTSGSVPVGGTPAAPPVDTMIHVIFGYIPTEILTLYVAALAALQQGEQVTSGAWIAFWVSLFSTPIIVWLLLAAKLKGLKQPLPLKFGTWPLWEMCAATIAYTAWAFALPHSPFTAYTWYSSAVSSFAVLVVSTFLGLLAPLFQKPLST
jgi:hypothetical protein